jgi:hypothetical protein
MVSNTSSLRTYFEDLNSMFWFYVEAVVSLGLVVLLVVGNFMMWDILVICKGWKLRWGTINFIAALVVCVLCSVSFTFTGHYL